MKFNASVDHGISVRALSTVEITADNVVGAVDAWELDPVEAAVTYGPISVWDTSGVTILDYTFDSRETFNGDVSSWDTSSVTSFDRAFALAGNFNGDISTWDTSSAKNLHGMFYHADSFNSDLGAWDTALVWNVESTFRDCGVFNSDLSAWDTARAVSVYQTFQRNTAFNADLSSWDVTKVTNCVRTFQDSPARFIPLCGDTWRSNEVAQAADTITLCSTTCSDSGFCPTPSPTAAPTPPTALPTALPTAAPTSSVALPSAGAADDIQVEIDVHLTFEEELSKAEAEDVCHELSETVAAEVGTSEKYVHCEMELESRRGRQLLSFNYHASLEITIPASIAALADSADVLENLESIIADKTAFQAAVEQKAVAALADIGGGVTVEVETIEAKNVATEEPASGASGMAVSFTAAAAVAVGYVAVN
jgi:surface protein